MGTWSWGRWQLLACWLGHPATGLLWRGEEGGETKGVFGGLTTTVMGGMVLLAVSCKLFSCMLLVMPGGLKLHAALALFGSSAWDCNIPVSKSSSSLMVKSMRGRAMSCVFNCWMLVVVMSRLKLNPKLLLWVLVHIDIACCDDTFMVVVSSSVVGVLSFTIAAGKSFSATSCCSSACSYPTPLLSRRLLQQIVAAAGWMNAVWPNRELLAAAWTWRWSSSRWSAGRGVIIPWLTRGFASSNRLLLQQSK